MPLEKFIEEELLLYRARWQLADYSGSWRALERAHVLAQSQALQHTRIHLLMLVFATRRGNWREVAGQILRLVLAPIGSVTGTAPLGNTGGADVSAFQPMPISDEMRRKLGSAGVRAFNPDDPT